MDAIAIKESGDQKLSTGDIDGAIRLYHSALEKLPYFAGCFYMLGVCYMQKKEFVRAASSFWTSSLYNRSDASPKLMTARALRFQPEFAESALEIFELVSAEQMDETSVVFYAEALCEAKRFYEARDLIPRFPAEPRFLVDYVKGLLETHIGDPAKGAALLAPLVNADSSNRVRDALLHCLYTLDRIDDARAVLRSEPENEFYACLDEATDILLHGVDTRGDANSAMERYCIVEAARYLRERISDRFIHTGTTFRTLDIAFDHVRPEGLLLEFGVRHGRTITHLAERFPGRRVYGFDSFEGIPEAWGDEPAGAYSTKGVIPKVPDNVDFVIGWYDQTLPGFAADNTDPVAFINIDCDLYSSTKTVFDLLGDRIAPGAVIVFDEYTGHPSWREDEFKAFQEWVASRGARYEYLAASLLTKQAALRITGFDD